MKILFITSTRIGDAILSTGLLSYLKGKYPKAQVTIACGPLAAPLFTQVPGLKQLIIFKRKRLSYHWFDLWMKCFLTSWDIIVDLRGSVMAYLLRTRVRYVWRSKPSSRHRVQQLSDLLQLEHPPSPTVWLNQDHYEKANCLLPSHETFIGIGPAANWGGKEWPLNNFKDLIEKLTADSGLFPNATLLLFASAHEKHQIQPLVHSLKSVKVVDLAGEVDLLEAAACLKRCTVYIGNDSGLMHLSAACGVPTVGLFGPSKVEYYAPWGEHTKAVVTDEPYEKLIQFIDKQYSLMTSLPVGRVYDAIVELFTHQEKIK
jgi:heptosyltransferase-3